MLKNATKEEPREPIFANKGIQVDGTNELHRVSIIVDDVQDAKEEDDVPSKVLPCQLPPKELYLGSFTLPCTIGSLNLYVIAELEASVNIMPKLMFEHLKLANLKKTDMLVEMADMTRKAPLGTMENITVKIKKILFCSDFVTMDMLREPNETMILGRPFLATIHAKIDVFNREISLGIGEDRVLFDMDGSVHHYKEPEVEHRDAKTNSRFRKNHVKMAYIGIKTLKIQPAKGDTTSGLHRIVSLMIMALTGLAQLATKGVLGEGSALLMRQFEAGRDYLL
ncbi:putative ribonuclease H-like domain-containing protein, partial [Tanacetum coccineum]